MVVIKSQLVNGVLLLFLLVTSCSSFSQEDRYFKPFVNTLENRLSIERDSMLNIEGDTKEFINQYIDNERYLLERKIRVKNDFLKSINAKKIIIIDKSINSYEGNTDLFFVFEKNNIYKLRLLPSAKEYDTFKLTIDNLSSDYPDIYELFKSFENGIVNGDDIDLTTFPSFGLYYLQYFNEDEEIIYSTTVKDLINKKEFKKLE